MILARVEMQNMLTYVCYFFFNFYGHRILFTYDILRFEKNRNSRTNREREIEREVTSLQKN